MHGTISKNVILSFHARAKKVLCVIYNLTTCTCEYFLALYFPSSVRTLCASRYGREMNKKENAFEGRKLVRTSRGPPLPSFYLRRSQQVNG